MNSRGPSHENAGASPEARPAGMSLGQWLNTKIAQPAPSQTPYPPQVPLPGPATDSLTEIHQRLDGITRQIDQISQRRPAPASPPTASGLASQLNDAISRLDMRLSNLTQPASQPRMSFPDQTGREPVAPDVRRGGYHTSPPLSPTGLENAIAEIAARQHALNGGGAYVPAPNPFMQYAPPLSPAQPVSPQVDLSGIERQLNHLTSQMQALRRPDDLDRSIAAFREELAEIRRSLTEALPRQAIDSLENEIRALGQKIEQSRESVGDQETLGGIERALNEIYGAVRTLTPAEQLAGYDSAIQSLSSKIDVLVRANPDSGIVQQLEEAIAALRNIAASVASNDAITHLSDHIHALAEKVDQLAQSGSHDMLAALEQRIALLTAAMEGRPVEPVSDTTHLERAIGALSERIDRLSVGSDSSGAMAHIEQRIAYLLERLEGSQLPSAGNLGRIEESLADILRQLEQQRVSFTSTDGSSDAFDTIRRELTDVRHSQSATEQRTQDTLEAMHSTLSHVVDRLAMIESDLRGAQSAAPQALVQAAPQAPAVAIRPELPNPVLPPMSDVLIPSAPPAASPRDEATTPVWQQSAQRAPIDPSLPPDFPLEPGARNRPEAVAAAEAGPDSAAALPDGGSQSNFIAAARRAAQAAAAAANEKPGRVSALTEAARNAAAKATARVGGGDRSAKPSRIRSILVGFGVVMIVISAFKVALTFLDSMNTGPAETIEKSAAPASIVAPQALPAPGPKAEAPAPASSPLLISPTAVARHSFVAPAAPAVPPASEHPAAPPETTGSVPLPAARSAPAPQDTAIDVAALAPVDDKIPEAVAGPMLRAAALRGEPAAAYEVATRFAEGRGIQVNYEEAIKWYARAAGQGIVPAMFRLGTLLEKGLGTKKDPDAARRYYMQAAERGNAKAMHNLAVLDADGGGRGPNYKAAATWFKKAAERGVADSQYNLGILYARGIGLEQNLAESYKWFSLAAAGGDVDAGRKRDDVAERLDQQSLAAAKLAIQTFTPERQPDDAINVASPDGGWDAAPPEASGKRSAKKPQARTASAR